MKTTLNINKSRLFHRAWYLVKNFGYTLSMALKKVWAEMKESALEKIRVAAETERLNNWWSSGEYKSLQANTPALNCSRYYHGETRGKYFGD